MIANFRTYGISRGACKLYLISTLINKNNNKRLSIVVILSHRKLETKKDSESNSKCRLFKYIIPRKNAWLKCFSFPFCLRTRRTYPYFTRQKLVPLPIFHRNVLLPYIGGLTVIIFVSWWTIFLSSSGIRE
jgi:hypothetical protein